MEKNPNEKPDGDSSSIKEEVETSSELTGSEKKSLNELKKLIEDNLINDQVTSIEENDQSKIWGVPLLSDERSDNIILRFLKARNFEVLSAFSMIKNTLLWRDEVGIESLLGEDLGNEYNNMVFIHGYDKEGYPVLYMVLEDILADNDNQITSDVQKHRKFLRWLIQFAEKNTRNIDFSKKGITNSFLLVIDIKSLTWYSNRDLYKVIYKFLQLLHDYYPDFVVKQLWINVSWWYRNYCRAYSMVFDVWSTKEEVVFSGRSKTTETLFKYISPAQVPVKLGGLSRDNDQDYGQSTINDTVSEINIKPFTTHRVEFNLAKACSIIWELRVTTWDVIYDAKFVPDLKESYTTNISRPRKLTNNDEPLISDGFRSCEPGNLILSIHNTTSMKKKLLVRVRVMAPGRNLDHEPSLRGWLVQSEETN